MLYNKIKHISDNLRHNDSTSSRELSWLFIDTGDYLIDVRGNDLDTKVIIELENLMNQIYKLTLRGRIRNFDKFIPQIEDICSHLAAMSYEIETYNLENFHRRQEFFQNAKLIGKKLITLSRFLEKEY